jgi:hypothetical protein
MASLATKVGIVTGAGTGIGPVVRLLSDEARYVTGHAFPVDGGVCAQ